MTQPSSPPPSPLPDPEEEVYGRVFWLQYLANTSLVLANALTFRFAELVNFLGGTERIAGDIVAVGLAVAVIVRLSAAHVIDDFGTRRMWILSTLLYLIGCGLLISARHLGWEIYVGRIAYVVGLTSMFACSMTNIQHHVPAHRRTEVIGNLGSSGFIGMILGSNLADAFIRFLPPGHIQFVALFGTAAVVGVGYLWMVVTLTHGDKPLREHPSSPAFLLLFRHWPGMVVLVSMIMGLGVTVTTVFLTRYATHRGIEGLGWFFSAYAVSAFAFRILARNWGHTIGRHWMLVRGLLGHTIGHAMLPFVIQDWQFILPAVICGFGHALLFPAVVSLGSGAFPLQSRGAGTAIILGFTDFGSLVFSPILGRIIVDAGFQAMFLTSAATGLVGALIYLPIALRYRDEETHSAVPVAPLAFDTE